MANGTNDNSAADTFNPDPFNSSDKTHEDCSCKREDKPTFDQVKDYLRTHPDHLEQYLMEEIELDQLERWVIRRSQRSKKKDPPNVTQTAQTSRPNSRKTSLSRWKFCVHADKRQMLSALTQSLRHQPTKDHVLWDLATCISSAVGADGFNLYVPEKDDGGHGLMALELNGKRLEYKRLERGITVPEYVARTGEVIRLSRGALDPRFPDGINGVNSTNIAHLLCQPVAQPDGKMAAVLELWRAGANGTFHEEDEEIVCSYLVWGGIALHYAHLYLTLNKQKKSNDFLLDVVKSIFQDMVSMDMLVIKIMNFAQRLVDADRASLFLVDAKNKDLCATIFDIGVDSQALASNDENIVIMANKAKEIRFPLGTGVAGHVAMTGEILNIEDAYADSRFNPTVDRLTGYKTKTILCMPIFIRGSIIGVVQMVNKHSGLFTKADEEAFEMFAVYCGLALHHAKLYDQIRKSEQKYRVTLEVLSYHSTSSESEVQMAIGDGIPQNLIGLDDYYFTPFDIDDYEKVRYAIFMFTDLFGLQRFDQNTLIRFTLTVRKNYRRVPYHNWTHGFSVANSMFAIIKHCKTAFKPNEALALYIGALCHDLDHRGKNNKFMLETASPLASIYSTSTMEHHHFNQTVTILQQEGHNILSKLTSQEYKEVLNLIKHCILATDLALFFTNKQKLNDIVEADHFDWSNNEHRNLLLAISMTSSDLSASAKPWDIQVKTVQVIFEEFYQQGDEERASGRQPISMMDRNQPEEQAASQVGFLTGICIPCYSLLSKLVRETEPMLIMCENNLKRWRQIDEERKCTADAIESNKNFK